MPSSPCHPADPIGVKTLQANVKRVHLAIREWAREQIFLGTRQYWEAAVEYLPLPQFMRSVRLITKSSAKRDEARSLNIGLESWVAREAVNILFRIESE